MAIKIINIGSSANKGDGDPLRTAFKKINENFAELDTLNTVRDIKGSVFGDDSTLLVDGTNSLIPSSVLSGSLPAIDGSALTGITATTFGGQNASYYLDFTNFTNTPTTIVGYGITDAFDGVFSSLTSKPTTLSGYGITDAYTKTEVDSAISSSVLTSGSTHSIDIVSSDSTLLVDSVNGTLNATTLTGALPAIDGSALTGITATTLGGQNASYYLDYNNFTNTPTLITNNNQLTNGEGYITASSTDTLTNKSGNISMFTNDANYLTSVPAQTFVSLADSPANFTGQAGKFVKVNAGENALEFDTVSGSSYTDSDVDTHLNTGTAGAGEVLSWSGSDYDWVANAGGLSDVVSDTTPQLGGALDLNNNNITGNGSINISGDATVSGNLVAGTGTVGGLTFAGTQIASDDSTQISFQDNIEIAGGPIISGFSLTHSGTFTINPYALNLTTTGGNVTVQASNYVILDSTNNGQINIGQSSGIGDVLIGNESNGTSVNLKGRTMLTAGVEESYTALTGQSGVVAHNCADGHMFYHTSTAGDITANFTNLGLVSGHATNLTIVIDQGNTAHEITAVQIGGAAQTIVWQNNNAPTGTANGVDSFSFTILKVSSSYVVLGQMVSFGGV